MTRGGHEEEESATWVRETDLDVEGQGALLKTKKAKQTSTPVWLFFEKPERQEDTDGLGFFSLYTSHVSSYESGTSNNYHVS